MNSLIGDVVIDRGGEEKLFCADTESSRGESERVTSSGGATTLSAGLLLLPPHQTLQLICYLPHRPLRPSHHQTSAGYLHHRLHHLPSVLPRPSLQHLNQSPLPNPFPKQLSQLPFFLDNANSPINNSAITIPKLYTSRFSSEVTPQLIKKSGSRYPSLPSIILDAVKRFTFTNLAPKSDTFVLTTLLMWSTPRSTSPCCTFLHSVYCTFLLFLWFFDIRILPFYTWPPCPRQIVHLSHTPHDETANWEWWSGGGPVLLPSSPQFSVELPKTGSHGVHGCSGGACRWARTRRPSQEPAFRRSRRRGCIRCVCWWGNND
ncbi:hypothetical protein IEQ34_000233 [Dendrobium chrysotoxum]|uniref:Uncharacterized protein n=1 Tax=Dendrobium chrysotoxum TaxID=161865 RepID=A0AAV7HTD1_DENCH|nr:hypothetical protein IEQ34_000233 [Dendrobium chrysotoxum]